MKKFHISLAVNSIAESIEEYSSKLGAKPDSYVENEYALWRTESLNFSIKQQSSSDGKLRHLGWEDSDAIEFTSEKDCNGILWENFSAKSQEEEINQLWPSASYKVE